MKEQASPIQKFTLVAAFRKLLLIRVLLGFYNDCFRLTLVRCFARLYCVTVCLVLCSYMFTDCRRLSYFYICILIQWLANVLVSLLTGEKSFFIFCEGVKAIDVKLKQPNLLLNPSLSHLIFLRLLLTKCLVMGIQIADLVAGYLQYSAWLHYFTTSYIWTALNISHVIKFGIFEITSQRVKLLRKFFQSNLGKTCPKKQHSASHTTKIIKEGMVIYKSLHDNLKMTMTVVKLQVTVALYSNFFNMLVHCYDILDAAAVHRLNPWLVVLEHGISSVLCCLPALFAENTGHEVAKMKLIFEDELLLCNDADLQAMIESSTDYLALCPIKTTVSDELKGFSNL